MRNGRRYDQEYKDMIADLFKSGMNLAELHCQCKVVKDNNLIINKYSHVNNSIKTKNGASDAKYIYIKRSYIFNYLWMNAKLSERKKNMYGRCSKKLLAAN